MFWIRKWKAEGAAWQWRVLSDEEKEKITERLLAGVDAKVAEENQDKNLYTVYAYSPCFSESASQGKKRVNLALTLYYDERKQQTNVSLAVPVMG